MPSTKLFAVPNPNETNQQSSTNKSDLQPTTMQPIPLQDHNKALWSAKEMDIDNLLTDPLNSTHHMDESS